MERTWNPCLLPYLHLQGPNPSTDSDSYDRKGTASVCAAWALLSNSGPLPEWLVFAMIGRKIGFESKKFLVESKALAWGTKDFTTVSEVQYST